LSNDALLTYDVVLENQMGEDGIFTESAIFDPDSLAETIYGVFDSVTGRSGLDPGNVRRQKIGARFITKTSPTFDVYENKNLTISRISKTYRIEYVTKDQNGVSVLWLV
jgi:hypothetical protein